MSTTTIYLERDPSGQRLLAVRLIGEHDEQRWTAPDDATPDVAVRQAAEWIRSQIDESGGSVGLLCLDPRGAVCSWIDIPERTEAMIRASVRQAQPGAWGEWAKPPNKDAQSIPGIVESLVPPMGATYEPVSARAESSTKRAAVLAMGDLPVRVLIDALDELRVPVQRIATLWHVMATAWDPAAEFVPSDDVLTTTPAAMDTAVVMIEPGSRVQWAWSDGGSLLAAGSARIEPTALVDDADARSFGVGRLATDWLAWSAQLGRAPRRVLCLITDGEGTDEGLGAFGRAIGQIWPEASVDLVRVDDPISATFARLQERTAGGKPRRKLSEHDQIESLANRPGRTHRGMFRWVAAAVLIAAVGLAVLGSKLRAAGADAKKQIAGIKSETGQLILASLGAEADPVYPELTLQSKLDEARQKVNETSSLRPTYPVLEAVDNISFIVSSIDGVNLTRLTIAQDVCNIELEGDDTESVELAPEIIKSAMRGFIDWGDGTISKRGPKTVISILGYWSENQPEPGS
ncbi:MAG TPA: hypothetical protein ENJ00_03705 [Phycisphaerales bacterium]|nr:hypothetical protein [Phycisphaerales bacterium]